MLLTLLTLAMGQTPGPAQPATVFEPTTFTLTHPGHQGQPFDLEASATFTHQDTGREITVGMYYDGGDTWRFRFTPTRPGLWTWRTAGEHPHLAGRSGSLTAAADPNARGFLTVAHGRYARMVGDERNLVGQTYTVYMNERSDRVRENPGFGGEASLVERWAGPRGALWRRAYIEQAQANGANAIFLHVNNQWFADGAQGWDDHDSVTPDRAVFAAIEQLIADAHDAGVQVHIWAWGDDADKRKWTPTGVPGGVNGPADRRIQRYIADRLGPLPGWSMGYGFDLFEWTNQRQVSDWANYIHARSGYPHNLSARGLALLGPDNTLESAPPNFVDGYACLLREGQILQTDGLGGGATLDDGGPDSYAETLEDLRHRPGRAILYEERHGYLRYHQSPGKTAWPLTDMDGTRRLLWWQAMAGGAGGWIGFYGEHSDASGDGPYPAPEQLRTHRRFWNGRFAMDMVVANELTGGPDARQYALQSPGDGRIVIFAEDADAIALRLADLPGPVRATLVDAEAEYAEVDLGELAPADQTLDLTGRGAPRDWALELTPIAAPQ